MNQLFQVPQGDLVFYLIEAANIYDATVIQKLTTECFKVFFCA